MLLSEARDQHPMSVSDDGRVLAYRSNSLTSGWDIHLLNLDGDPVASPFRTTPANEHEASISPDSRFVAYMSDESGQPEVYVRAVSGEGGEVPVSTGGGRWPHWSPGGDELFYVRGSTRTTMMAVPVELGTAFRRLGAPQPLFEGDYEVSFDVVPAGPHHVPGDTRFVMLTRERTELSELNVVLNWHQELLERVPIP